MCRALLSSRWRYVRSADDVADAAADLLPYGISLWGPRASAIFGAAAVSDVDAHRGAFARAVDSPSSRPINSAASRSNEKSVAVSDVDAHCGADGCPGARADADADGDTFVKPFGRPGACADAKAYGETFVCPEHGCPEPSANFDAYFIPDIAVAEAIFVKAYASPVLGAFLVSHGRAVDGKPYAGAHAVLRSAEAPRQADADSVALQDRALLGLRPRLARRGL